MPRKNLAGNCWGESERLTVRLGPVDLRSLDELTAEWESDRSEVVRRVLREAATSVRRRRRDDIVAALPNLNLVELRSLARQHHIDGRSKMRKDQLLETLRARLQW